MSDRITIEYSGGKNPFEDINAFVSAVKAKHPYATEHDIRVIVKRAVNTHRSRIKNKHVVMFGFDIMTADPTKERWWPWLDKSMQKRILDHPYDSGEIVNRDADEGKAANRIRLARSTNRARVNRSILIGLPGQKETYVWNRHTRWTQDVDPDDYDLIRSVQHIARRFQRVDAFGPVRVVRSYTMEPQERHIASTQQDIDALKREFLNRPTQYSGVDLHGKE